MITLKQSDTFRKWQRNLRDAKALPEWSDGDD